MKFKRCLKKQLKPLGVLGAIAVLTLFLNPLPSIEAQSGSELLLHTGAGDTFTLTFSPPTGFFEYIGSSVEQFLLQRSTQSQIIVVGAGATQQIRTKQPLSSQKIRRVADRIEVRGAGSVKDIAMTGQP